MQGQGDSRFEGTGSNKSECQERTETLCQKISQEEVLFHLSLREFQRYERWRDQNYASFDDYCDQLGLDPRAVELALRALNEFLEAGCQQAELVEAGLGTIITLRNAIITTPGRWDARRRSKLLRLVRESGLLPGQLLKRERLQPLLQEAMKRGRSTKAAASPPVPLSELGAADTSSADSKLAHREILSRISAQILAGPPSRWPEPPSDFAVNPSHWRELVLTVHLEQNALLIGPTGSGKSQLIRRLAEILDRPYFNFNFGGTLDPRSELLGTTQLRSGQTTFCDAHFLRALQTPRAVIALDELNRCDGMFLNLLNPILDGQRKVVIGERLDAPEVEVAAGISFFGIANIGPEYAHTVPLDRALIDRFDINVSIEYPSLQEEERLLVRHFPRLDRGEARQLALIAAQQRKLASVREYNLYVSTRMLFAAAARACWGSSLPHAVEYAITSKLSDSGEGDSQRLKFRLLVQKMLGSAA